MSVSKRVNPLLPFVLCATSVFADNVNASLQDEQFQGELRALALLEERMGQAKFEQLMATVVLSASKRAWAQLFEAAQSVQQSSSGGVFHPSLH
jgi:hypothetical protein